MTFRKLISFLNVQLKFRFPSHKKASCSSRHKGNSTLTSLIHKIIFCSYPFLLQIFLLQESWSVQYGRRQWKTMMKTVKKMMHVTSDFYLEGGKAYKDYIIANIYMHTIRIFSWIRTSSHYNQVLP